MHRIKKNSMSQEADGSVILSPMPAQRITELGREFYDYLYGYMEIIIAEEGNPESFFDFMDKQYNLFIREVVDEGLLSQEEEVYVEEQPEQVKVLLKAIALKHLTEKKRQLLRLAHWLDGLE